MGRAARQPVATAGADQRFTAAFGSHRGLRGEAPVAQALRYGDWDALLAALPELQPADTHEVIAELYKQQLLNPQSVDVFKVPALTQHAHGPGWEDWNSELDEFMFTAVSSDHGGNEWPQVLAHLDGHWEDLGRAFAWAHANTFDRVKDLDSGVSPGSGFLEILRHLPPDGPLAQEMAAFLDGRTSNVADARTMMPLCKHDNPVYLFLRDGLLSRNHDQNTLAAMWQIAYLQSEDVHPYGIDPQLFKALQSKSLRQPEKMVQTYGNLLANASRPPGWPVRELAALKIVELYGGPDRYQAPLSLYRHNLHVALAFPHNRDLLARSDGQECLGTLLAYEGGMYRNALSELFSEDAQLADTQTAETLNWVETFASQQLAEAIAESDGTTSPTQTARDIIHEECVTRFTALSLNGGYERIEQLAGSGEERQAELAGLTPREWRRVWRKVFAGNVEANTDKLREELALLLAFRDEDRSDS